MHDLPFKVESVIGSIKISVTEKSGFHLVPETLTVQLVLKELNGRTTILSSWDFFGSCINGFHTTLLRVFAGDRLQVMLSNSREQFFDIGIFVNYYSISAVCPHCNEALEKGKSLQWEQYYSYCEIQPVYLGNTHDESVWLLRRYSKYLIHLETCSPYFEKLAANKGLVHG